ncbi:alpha/beta fold hydrolase [Thermomonospora umbrina]|uniref:Pimeloyl-ACP methyl ester carboxylesterase n=1 Tax=Thermomonospora umbrina TaxID=111806 RepID=A0A3D9SY55_9ACTN|nr:alpha/beta hydrolase [Thermomonospora umbrina]REE97494.1 pimeloyl-ACP methyl ester carboxylesterase [Thermomonospora umbrina]
MLAYERVGAGEPLVLLHGIAHRRQAWYPVVDRLSRHRELILVDLPGHGESPKLARGRSPSETVVDELLTFFQQAGLDRPHIAGNSIGGLFGLKLASLGAARSVTALSPGGFWYSYADFAYTLGLFGGVMGVGTVLSPFAKKLTATKAGRALLFFWIYNSPTKADPELALGDYRALLRARLTMLRFITVGAPFRDSIPSDVPVTIAWSRRDMVLPPYQARVARKRMPDARHFDLPRCGHVPMGDDPDLVSRIILDGSNSIDPDRNAPTWWDADMGGTTG